MHGGTPSPGSEGVRWRSEDRRVDRTPSRRCVPRPLPGRSVPLQARRSTSNIFSGAAGARLRNGILPFLTAHSPTNLLKPVTVAECRMSHSTSSPGGTV